MAPQQGSVAEEVHAEAAYYVYREHADVPDWYGSVFWIALSRTRVESAGNNVKLIPAQFIHRVRDLLVARRTSVINQLRAFLLERGMVFAKAPCEMKVAMPRIQENPERNLTPRMWNLVGLLWSEWKELERQIVVTNEEVEQIAWSDPARQRLRRISGIGPLIATAIGNGAAYSKGQEFSCWLGLVPGQSSTGGARLFGISKRGNCYLRKLLIHGARSAVLGVKRERSPFGSRLDALERRAPVKIIITAAANKLARAAWAVLSSGNDYRFVSA